MGRLSSDSRVLLKREPRRNGYPKIIRGEYDTSTFLSNLKINFSTLGIRALIANTSVPSALPGCSFKPIPFR